jgi:hypothetical protein
MQKEKKDNKRNERKENKKLLYIFVPQFYEEFRA